MQFLQNLRRRVLNGSSWVPPTEGKCQTLGLLLLVPLPLFFSYLSEYGLGVMREQRVSFQMFWSPAWSFWNRRPFFCYCPTSLVWSCISWQPTMKSLMKRRNPQNWMITPLHKGVTAIILLGKEAVSTACIVFWLWKQIFSLFVFVCMTLNAPVELFAVLHRPLCTHTYCAIYPITSVHCTPWIRLFVTFLQVKRQV